MEVLMLWIAFCILAGYIASNKGRSAAGFFLLSFCFTPIVGILFALAAKPGDGAPGNNKPTPATHNKCPDCRELILKGARVCKHCGCRIAEDT